MWPDLTQRSTKLELMDDLTIGGEQLAEALRQLRVINGMLGSAWLTLEGVVRLWHAGGRPRQLSILDVGSGSGDINRLLLAWASLQGIAMRITLVDIHPETCAAAAAYFRDEARVQVLCSDLMRLGLGQVDIVTAALFTHHFSSAQLPAMYAALAGAARLGVVVNDLHRHWLAWAGIWVATRLLSRNAMIRHDAPLSVLRGFRSEDLEQLRTLPDFQGLSYRWRPFFRYLVLVDRVSHSP